MSTDTVAREPGEPVLDPSAEAPKRTRKRKPKGAAKIQPTDKPVAIPPNEIPNPFRRADLDRLIAKAQKASTLPSDHISFRPARFIELNGLPKPTKAIAVQANLAGVLLESRVVDAYDESDAQNKYIAIMEIKSSDVHRCTWQCFIREG